MKASALIDAVVRAKLASTLKADGFKKSSRTFLRLRGSVAHVLNVQASAWNSGDEGRLTLNLGVYVPELARTLGEAVLEKPKEHQCHARQRIGALMAGGGDQWWEVSPSADIDSVANELDTAYRELARAWFESLSTPADLEASPTCRGGDLARAALALAAGRPRDAARLVGPVIANPDRYSRGYVAEVVKFAQRHGLGPPT